MNYLDRFCAMLLIATVAMMEVNCGGQPAESECDPPRPQVVAIEPTSTKVHSPSVLLTVRGNNFVSNSAVFFDGHALVTTYVGSQQLRAVVPLDYLHRIGDIQVDVFNPVDATSCSGLFIGQSHASNSLIFTIVP